MSYTRLSEDERYQIQHLHGGGFSAREIGAWLERAATTISRELRRNQGGADQYHARCAAAECKAQACSERASSDSAGAMGCGGSTFDG